MRPKRRPKFFLVFVVLLVLALGAGIGALWLRGFKWEDLNQNESTLTTPTMSVWVVKIPDYAEKMDAYKVAVANASNGFGSHVIARDGRWQWVVGIYAEQAQADAVRQNTALPVNAVCECYQITGKKIPVDPTLIQSCEDMFDTIQNAYQQLQILRDQVEHDHDTSDTLIKLSDLYHSLKANVEILQQVNTKQHNPFLASLIYTANINILGLHEIVLPTVTGKAYLSKINTAIIQSIFSLDNF